MTIEEFIYRFNSIVPEIKKIVDRWNKVGLSMDYPQAEHYIEQMFLKPNKNLAETSNPIEYLICNTNLSSIGIGSINFRATYKRIEPTIGEFASYHDFYKLCVNENTFDIISFSQEFAEDQEIIARSVDDFLNFLLIYKEYDAFLIYDRETDISTLKGQLVVLESKGFSNGLVRDLIKL